MTRLVVVVGTGRCGSSLVHELLCRHEDAGFLSNLEDRWPLRPGLGRWNNALLRSLPVVLTEKGRLRFAPSEGYRSLAREVTPALVDPVRDLTAEDAAPWLRTSFERFVTTRAVAQGKSVFVHKFTGFPRTGFVSAVFPSARFLHVVRDGRAVVRSWLRMPWWLGHRGPGNWQFGPLSEEQQLAWERSGRSFPVLAALAWVLLMDAHDRARRELPEESWNELAFEEVLAAPGPTLARVVPPLGLDATPQFLGQIGRVRFRPAGDQYRALVEELGATEAARVQVVLEPALLAHGYG